MNITLSLVDEPLTVNISFASTQKSSKIPIETLRAFTSPAVKVSVAVRSSKSTPPPANTERYNSSSLAIYSYGRKI